MAKSYQERQNALRELMRIHQENASAGHTRRLQHWAEAEHILASSRICVADEHRLQDGASGGSLLRETGQLKQHVVEGIETIIERSGIPAEDLARLAKISYCREELCEDDDVESQFMDELFYKLQKQAAIRIVQLENEIAQRENADRRDELARQRGAEVEAEQQKPLPVWFLPGAVLVSWVGFWVIYREMRLRARHEKPQCGARLRKAHRGQIKPRWR